VQALSLAREFLGFLRQIEKSVPESLDAHLIVNNYCTHQHALARRPSAQRQVRAWLVQRPRFHDHYIPTYASWLNQVERWFGIITLRSIRRGSFSSVLVAGFRAAVRTDRQD
jgi:putative transposase